jgi:hypothetical protein
MNLTEVLPKLKEPFPVEKISFKVQTKPSENGNSLIVAYIDARVVMDRLDDVVGGEWSDSYAAAVSGGLECSLTVLGVTRRDVGKDDNENEQEKSAYSDAFKRAAVKFGVGRFLYDLPKMWAKVRPIGKTFVLADGEESRLRAMVLRALNPSLNDDGFPSVEKIEASLQKQEKIPQNNSNVWSAAQKNALITAGLAKNDYAAKGMLGLSNLPGEAHDSIIIAWGKAYRKVRTEMTAPEAADYANDLYSKGEL